jgi:shikimate kinase
MPNSGKSSVGYILSKSISISQKDTDTLITMSLGMSPKDIVEVHGRQYFLDAQERIVLENDFTNCIVSTGGGIIYSFAAMEYLRKFGIVYFLYSSINELKSRITTPRRFSGNSNQNYDDLFIEREPLYKKYADHTINCNEKSIDEIALIIKELHKNAR